MVVEPDNLPFYRRLFSVVFSDSHLFRELYGIQRIDRQLAEAMFEFLGIGHKAKLTDRRFSTVRLSGGQRKRLSMTAAITHDQDYLAAGDVHWHVEAGMVIAASEVHEDPQRDLHL
jgi:putative ATP-binding cassette transporter